MATVVTQAVHDGRSPDLAVFGEKDYQQLASDPRTGARTWTRRSRLSERQLRAEDGLALSSRNGYLSDEQRAAAPGAVSRPANDCRGTAPWRSRLRTAYRDLLQAQQRTAGFIPDYLEIRNAVTLRPAQIDDRHLVIWHRSTAGQHPPIYNLVVELPASSCLQGSRLHSQRPGSIRAFCFCGPGAPMADYQQPHDVTTLPAWQACSNTAPRMAEFSMREAFAATHGASSAFPSIAAGCCWITRKT